MIAIDDPDVTVYVGDAIEVLRSLPADSIDCCVTSPPYWGLRDYGTAEWEGGDSDCDHLQKTGGTGSSTLGAASGGHDMSEAARERSTTRSFVPYAHVCGKCGARRVDKQIGLEESPEQYIERMVAVFAEVHRVLKPEGTCWLNLGDSYATQPGKGSNVPQTKHPNSDYPESAAHRSRSFDGLKPKDMVGIPWMVAFALRDFGWWLRMDVIWEKPNAMPESVDDRPTKSHEYVFQLTKSARYYWNKEAVLEPYESTASAGNKKRKYGSDIGVPGGHEGDLGRGIPWKMNQDPPQQETLGDLPPEAPRGPDGRRKTHVKASDGSIQHRDGDRWPNEGRNIRSVWSIVTQPYAGAHFAVFPEELARRCISASCPEFVCGTCGQARRPIVEVESSWEERKEAGATRGNLADEGKVGAGTQRGVHGDGVSHDLQPKRRQVVGYTDCGHADYQPGVVLDPFLGSGTTAFVARKLGRRAIGIELNQQYVDDHVSVRLAQQSLFSGSRF